MSKRAAARSDVVGRIEHRVDLALAAEPPANDDGDTPVAGDERRRLEDELETILCRFTHGSSELAMTLDLPRAKALYERLHPASRHGGSRTRRKKQDATFASWPTFTQHVAETRGLCRRTIQYRLVVAGKLASLDKDAERASLGTALANKLHVLVRIAAIPSAQLQRDLVLLFDRTRKHAEAELIKYEAAFGLPPSAARKRARARKGDNAEKPSTQEDSREAAEPDEAATGTQGGTQASHNNRVDRLDQQPSDQAYLTRVMAALNATTVDGCLEAIRRFEATQQEVGGLRAQLRRAEETRDELKRHLSIYQNASLGQLFTLLGVTTARDALEKVRVLLEVGRAAE